VQFKLEVSPPTQTRFHFKGEKKKEGFGEKKERGRLLKTRSFKRND